MKRVTAALAALFALVVLPAFAASDRGYDNGPVWDFAAVQTKDGHFDDYMKFVTTTWKKQQEALKKAGYITDYKVYVVVDPRDNEPDIYLATQVKNMAEYDRSLDEMEAFFAKQFGSQDQANKEQADRGMIRTLRGETLTRELILK
ncbi:MAG TPA: hypothetical protein VMS78_11180 [Rhizomicrobium sp.]|nr:hypothetical protein [Rhizomicrobium sp.]